MRTYLALLTVLVGIVGCEKRESPAPQPAQLLSTLPAGASMSGAKSLPPELRRQTGTLSNLPLGCIVGGPTANAAAVFVINTTNQTGIALRDAVAHLFLLDKPTRDFLRLSVSLGTVPVGAPLRAQWQLDAASTLGSNWQANLRTFSNAMERAHRGQQPETTVFISTPGEVFEVAGSSTVTYYFPTGTGPHLQTEKKLVEGSIRSTFEQCGVELPKP